MWSKVAEEMAVPWRAAEAMHWQLGEADMARRAGVIPFSLSTATLEPPPPPSRRVSPNRGHSRGMSQSASGSSGSSNSRFSRPATSYNNLAHTRETLVNIPHPMTTIRRDSIARCVPPSPGEGLTLAGIGSGTTMGMGRGTPVLPSLQEMTTGVSPYDTPAYTVPMQMGAGYSNPGPGLPSIGTIGVRHEAKRRASPEMPLRDTSRRKRQ